MIIEITPDPQRGGMYWGPGPLPHWMTILGVIHIEQNGWIRSGALMQHDRCGWFIGTSGVTGGLPQRETTEAFKAATTPEMVRP